MRFPEQTNEGQGDNSFLALSLFVPAREGEEKKQEQQKPIVDGSCFCLLTQQSFPCRTLEEVARARCRSKCSSRTCS